jgi:hypothetical protein
VDGPQNSTVPPLVSVHFVLKSDSFCLLFSITMSFMNGIQSLLSRGKESPAKSALILSLVIATGVAAYTYAFPSNKSSDLAPAVTEEDAKKMMKLILDKLKLLAPRLMGAAQNIKQQIQQQGQDIDDVTLMKQFILPHFDSNLKEIQDAVLEEFDVDEDELEEAVDVYIAAGDAELIDIAKSIRVLHKQFGGDVEIENEEAGGGARSATAAAMGIQEVVELMEELARQMLQYTDDFCGTFVDERGVPTMADRSSMEEFQMGLMAVSQRYGVWLGVCLGVLCFIFPPVIVVVLPCFVFVLPFTCTLRAEKSLLQERGLTESDLQSLIMEHQDNRIVQEVFMGMQVLVDISFNLCSNCFM